MEGQSAGNGFEVNTLPPRSPDGIFFPQGHNIGICFPGPGRGIGLLLPPWQVQVQVQVQHLAARNDPLVVWHRLEQFGNPGVGGG